nr:putative ribonuclease H-like domain-containing protein [Tanacetum cinerariifolium]
MAAGMTIPNSFAICIVQPYPVSTGQPNLVSAGQPNPVSAGEQNTVSAGSPNPVYAGQPNLVFAGNGILGLRPLNIQPTSTYFHSFTHNNQQIIFPITHNSLYSLYKTGGLDGKTVVKPSAGWPWTKSSMSTTKGSKINGGSKSKSWSFAKGLLCRPKMEKEKDKGIVDSGCSRSMSGNKDKLEDFEHFDGGEVTFGGSTRKILGKGTIKTKTLNFENVLYVEELQHFNLISVSQICDQTSRVLFTEKECLVLLKDFPILDPRMVILSMPKKHNLYTFSLNDLAPQGPLTCLIAKASQNESTLWHRRLCHVNFRNMNKLVKGNLVRGARTMLADSFLPTIFWTKAVATACYVLNRVLVTKPYAKTPDELLTGDKPSISYLKPFGCYVTILNTSESLGKFDKKSDEGTGQAWMFDIDYLTDSLNYSRASSTNLTAEVPIVDEASIQHDGSQEDDSNLDDEPDVLIIHSTPTPEVPIVDEASIQHDGKEEVDRLGLAFLSPNPILGIGSTSVGSSISAGSTPLVSAGSTPPLSPCASPIFTDRHSISAGQSPVPAARPPVSAGRPTDSAGRLVTAGRPSGSAARTLVSAGRILGKVTESASSDRFPRASSVETLDIHDGLTIFDCPKSGIFTSSSYDKDLSGPDANNLESSFDEEGIDYTDVFAPVARFEAIRLFLAFASFIGFKVYQMDVKSAFLYGKIAEEVYVTQPRGFEDPDHPNKVYKVVKALKDWCANFETLMQSEFEMSSIGPLTFFLGLRVDQRPDGIFIHQTKYVADIIKKFDLDNSKLASTPFEPQKIKEKNVPDSPISVHLYRSMIGCLMYLTATRPDIIADGTVKRFSTLRELMHWVGRADLMVLYGLVLDKYKLERATGIGLGLWSDLRMLITAREDREASIIWDDQDQWEIQRWRFYALLAIHVLETEAGDIMYMFVDKKYPILLATIQRMLNHGLEIGRDPSGNDLTTAIQLIQSLLNQLHPAT